MMKKLFLSLFVGCCLILFLLPSVGMIFFPTNETIGNEQEVALPALKTEEGGFNFDLMGEWGNYFEKHFALRKAAITADAEIQSKVFSVSNVDSVVVGKNNWLYYTSSLNDYLGRDPMSERDVRGVLNNLSMIQSYCRNHGAEFLFTIAPNKNTLYPENMPYYYSLKTSSVHNRDLLNKALEKSDINYYNLFRLFEEQDEVLYLERDSHWSNEGARRAFDALLTHQGKAHDDFSTAESVTKKDFKGDLSRMLYPAIDDFEFNTYFGAEESYQTDEKFQSVEDTLIRTKNDDATEKLYMYRDSFGNALVPFFAASFEEATFSKAFAADLEMTLENEHPDLFLMELVERNLDWLITMPPYFPSQELTFFKEESEKQAEIDFSVEQSEYSAAYLVLQGLTDDKAAADAEKVYVACVDDSGKEKTFEAFFKKTQDGTRGYAAFVKSDALEKDKVKSLSLIVEKDGVFSRLTPKK